MDAYRSKDWYLFRREVIRLDNNACTICGRKESDGVILQVHHKQYFKGRKPWEYPYQLCMTVCKGCHASEHGIIPPKFGWEHIGWDDLGGLDGTCECCGTSIRYVFIVTHENWTPMEVGTVCCDNLTSTQVASDVMDSHRRYSTRRKTFISSTRWRKTDKDCEAIRRKRLNIDLIRQGAVYKICLDGEIGKKSFPSILEAKIAIFELVESGKLHEYQAKRRQKSAYHGKYRG